MKIIRISFVFFIWLLYLGCTPPQTVKRIPIPPPVPKKPPKVFEPISVYPKPKEKTDEDRVREHITNNSTFIRYLYTKHCRITPGIKGTLDLELEINDMGQVYNLEVIESTIKRKAFEKDIINYIKTLEFENLKDGELTVFYSFVF